ncbi:RNA polymerase sigma factor [Clostridium sp. Cult3]|uniref:RNA polymerase sigma factor n=1 Tax=Clostridium sp. Cult3 TaxID=2079004 RepID=UPI001F2DC34F|nr:sigma-70 family RNA polymerase sigma factor [Clostridium sp. Cult3]MCF6460326.1 hypothetical protein [Clostridium sp. Cult3]
MKVAFRGYVDGIEFEQLIWPYTKILYNYILSKVSNAEDVQDILQETMLAIWQGMDNYKGNSSFKTWAIGIARRKIADFYRGHYKDKDFHNLEDLDIGRIPGESNPIDHAINSIDIENSLNTLPLEDKELLFLIFNAGLNYKEIESITGISEGTIKSRVYCLKKKLRPLLVEGGI